MQTLREGPPFTQDASLFQGEFVPESTNFNNSFLKLFFVTHSNTLVIWKLSLVSTLTSKFQKLFNNVLQSLPEPKLAAVDWDLCISVSLKFKSSYVVSWKEKTLLYIINLLINFQIRLAQCEPGLGCLFALLYKMKDKKTVPSCVEVQLDWVGVWFVSFPMKYLLGNR